MLGRSYDKRDAELRAESPRQGRVFALAGVVQVWLLFARQLGLISGLHAKCYRVGFRPSAVSGQVKPAGGVGHGSFNPFSMASPESAWSVRNQRAGEVPLRIRTGLWHFCVY